MVRWSDEEMELPFRPITPARPRIPPGFANWLQQYTDGDFTEITDHNSALRFLDPSYSESTPYQDDYVIALAGAKKAENDSASHQEKVAKAVRLIANQRNSAALQA